MQAIIGIDCATDDRRIGVALGALLDQGDKRIVVNEVQLCSRERSAAAVVADWLRNLPDGALLALDAPLGWPDALARALSSHMAGESIAHDPATLFRRTTDRWVAKHIGITPLDVGADRIARTAHAALSLLGDLSPHGSRIPLAWEPNGIGVRAIEVYPAATLKAKGWRYRGYKKPGQHEQRDEMIDEVQRVANLGTFVKILGDQPDALDAVICLLAGVDFIEGSAAGPAEGMKAIAHREGWIWVKPPA
jgi:hypothetical protein